MFLLSQLHLILLNISYYLDEIEYW